MDPEFKKVMNQHLKLARENNEILRAMRRQNRFSKVAKFLKYIIILSLAFGIWYYLKPVFDQARQSYNDVSDSLGSIKNTGDSIKGVFGGNSTE
ncbi:MAG: hypothetical protein OEX08_02770 [Candidatus Nomurabacteria bacterium]|nr:hypothetical protein [Candidatus Nomurabacteria bacterium]